MAKYRVAKIEYVDYDYVRYIIQRRWLFFFWFTIGYNMFGYGEWTPYNFKTKEGAQQLADAMAEKIKTTREVV